MPGLVPGIHVLRGHLRKVVDGRDKPGPDEICGRRSPANLTPFPKTNSTGGIAPPVLRHSYPAGP
jgi:hypothetical protein